MVNRRLLTQELLRNLDPPVDKEYWIADTQLPGFGVRVCHAYGGTTFSYAIRKSDKTGKSVRRSLNLDELRREHYNAADYAFGMASTPFFERDLASFLPEARKWARLEIAKITGKIESDAVLEKARRDDAKYREKVGQYISGFTLTYCVELVLKYGKERGWSEEYQDRLWRAFVAFDSATQAGTLTIDQLANGVLADKIEGAPIGFSTIRLLRSLLNVVADNVSAMNGPPRGRLLPQRLIPHASPKEEAFEFLESLELKDFEIFFANIRHMNATWQSKISIELAFYFYAPFSRILRGRWSHIVENRWYPYGAKRRKSGYVIFERIEGPAEECLKLAKAHAAEYQTNSDLWFPAESNALIPIKNVDRTWKKIIRQNDWPDVSLGFASKYFNHTYYWWNMTDWLDHR